MVVTFALEFYTSRVTPNWLLESQRKASGQRKRIATSDQAGGKVVTLFNRDFSHAMRPSQVTNTAALTYEFMAHRPPPDMVSREDSNEVSIEMATITEDSGDE